MAKKTIRIGTRQSPLALWQAQKVQKNLIEQGFETEIVGIKSLGDVDLKTPIYEMGVQGVFTKAADTALLNHKIDIAVHSLKDVPTAIPRGLTQAAVLPRDSPADILVFKENTDFLDTPLQEAFVEQYVATIATGSIRRKAQWLNRYPHHRIENLRGNMQTRLETLQNNAWDGAIFAAAGLERIGLRPSNSIELDWMLPAPAQGAIVVLCRQEDEELLEACAVFNHSSTALCTAIERDFLRYLQGGCSLPIAALAFTEGYDIVLKGSVYSPNGAEKMDIELSAPILESLPLGQKAAQKLLERGATKLMR
ncbi:MAG: hydroxymethylbilane synthase [Saprospiraceae bacterium]|nr:hydroxymethylbilane synthase [Saprospiraceae bacterium]